jgi:hypothetical protein
MRKIELGVIHCSGSRENQSFTVEELRELHVEKNGWSDIGYHYYYTRDGKEHIGRPIERPGAHAKGHNKNSVALAYEGGLDSSGKPADTRTHEQILAMGVRINKLRVRFGQIPFLGHRDLSPDKNGDGTIEANERMKECPCYHAIEEHNDVHTLKKFLIHFYN